MSHVKLSDSTKVEESPTCYLIGQDNLLVEGAKLLLSKSFSIKGIISPFNDIQEWGHGQGIPCFHSIGDIEWQDKSADYLFSIVNNEIIPSSVLKKIRHLAINYHDAPLPKYAGSNATSWAIIHGEHHHAVTWHVINEVIDGGDILKQRLISLHPDETALSLNYKCAEQAIASFSELIDELLNGSYQRTPQELDQRSYFGRSKKPINNGWVNWNNSGEQIDRLFRATQFGFYRNPFATTKIVLGDEVFVIDALTLLSDISEELPGTILKTTESYWNIATQTKVVTLSELSTVKGESVELDTLARQYKIVIGTQLHSPSLQEGELLLKLSQEYFSNEVYWIDKLRVFQPMTVTAKQPEVDLRCLPKQVFVRFLDFSGDKEEASLTVLAAWLVYLHRLESLSQLNIFVDLGNSIVPDSLRAFFATHLPFSVTINDRDNFYQIIQQVKQECQQIRQHGSYLRDCWHRYPELAESIVWDHAGYSVTVGTITASLNGSAELESLLPKPFLTLCEELLTHPDHPITGTDWITQEERQKLLIDWNSTDTSYPAHQTIHGLFEEQVTKTPHHLALIAEDVHLTYEELNVRANQLANYLVTHQAIQPDQLIAVCLERSEWMLIALLGILKSGGAYVPIDSDYPVNRINYIVKETNTKVILTTQVQQQKLLNLPDIDWKKTSLLVLDAPDFLHILKNQSTKNPLTKMTSRHLAYVMYTSGTTGIPKGIQIEHQGIVNRITWMNQAYPLRSTDRILQKTPYVFDVSVWELFWANWYGAAVVFAKPEGHKEPLYLSQLIQKEQVSIIHFTPSMLNGFVHAMANYEIPISSLRHLFCSGEALDVFIVRKAKIRLPDVEIHNLYGPTEASIDVLFYDCGDQQSVYLGKPIANTRAYVLDEQCRLLPVGSKGELYISGDGLARGYLNQVELTSQRFIANPFQSDRDKKTGSYARLYKTGDMACWLPSGNLTYLGRNDRQVKLHGYRIELEEIEQVIQRCPMIQQSVVTLINNQLVAYCVTEQMLNADSIQTHIARYLPNYMVPNQIVFLKKLPLTINGKVDYKKLPLPDKPYSQQITHPSTMVQAHMVAVWSAVLGLPATQISITDDFFKLGGDSILAIRLVSRLNERLPQKIQVKDVLQLKTIQALSAMLEKQGEPEAQQVETPYEPFSLVAPQHYQDMIQTNKIEDIYPASYLQMGMLLESDLNDHGTYHDVFYYEINLPFNQERFLAVWEALASKHGLLRARFMFSDEHGLDVVIFKKAHLHYQLHFNQPLQQLVDAERLTPFSHTEECLFHLIVNQHAGHFEFIFSFHHAIVDGWSVASLIHEFVQAYAYDQKVLSVSATKQNLISSLSYGEFVRKEREHLHDQTSISFWESYLADSEPAQARWKFDDTATSSDSLFTSRFLLTPSETKLVHQLAGEQAISVDCVFLSAYFKTLSFFLNSDDVTIGVVFNNRLEKKGGDALFGLFLNVLPFRFQLNRHSSLQEELSKIFTTKMEIYAHKHIPYAHLKSTLKRDLYHVGFNFIHFHELQQSEQVITRRGGFDRTSIPLLLEVTQEDTFKVELKAHDNYISQQYLDYFGHYLQLALQNILHHKNELSLDTYDYQKMIIDWNATQRSYPHEKTLHQLFEEQVQKTPDAIALVYEGKQLTYQELNSQANQLAHYLLQQYQVKPDELITLCLDRNELTLIAILAVWKAGAAYVPVEPGYPDERLSYILRDTRTGMVLTNAKYQSRIQIFSTCDVIALDDSTNQSCFQLKPLVNPVTAVASDNLAYVIYTSGTTGQPNGVMIEHHSVINTLCSLAPVYQLTKNKRASAYTSYVFDVSVAEFFTVLIAGGELHLLDAERKDIHQLSAYLLTHEINVAYLPPAVLSILPKVDYPALDVLIFAGEPFAQAAGEFWATHYDLYNYYGPTEFTIYCTGKRASAKNINIIGRPINNTKAFVLNKDGNPVPMGTIGELHLSGMGVARGYLNNSDLTGEKFVLNKFQLDDERQQYTKLYKTGDLVRWLPDGELEYIRRNDSQVKINGFRIELSEIEATLNSHPEVKQSVVLALEHTTTCLSNLNANKYLVVYYVSNLELSDNDEENYTKQWEKLYESEYDDLKLQDYQENITGWNSSYTGEPLSKEEMHEWLNETLKRILSLQPKRALEIGSGTGMLLFNLINNCQHYYATDFSEHAVQYMGEMSRRLGFQDKVTCVKEEAAKLPFPLLKEKYTTAILNSVIQYFPTLDYLEGTLNNLIENITQPGTIFIGDVRDYRLLPCFHYSVLKFKKHPIDAQTIDFFVKREKELAVSPNYFLYLKQINPKISHVELLPKLGVAANEMNLYRYDVILHIGEDSSCFESLEQHHFLPIANLEACLSNNPSEIITFQYPNKKILKEYSECNKAYGNQPALSEQEITQLLTLVQVKQLLSRYNYEAHFYLSPETPSALNIVGFSNKKENFKKFTISYKEGLSFDYANNPLLNMKLIKDTNNQEIKNYLQSKLPYYMVPMHLVPLKEFPLAPSGKLNLKALPDLDLSVSENYCAPRDEQDEEICAIFAELLALPVDKVGIKDNFFNIGGNSLLAIVLVSKLNKKFAVNLKICDIFKQENIANLNALIGFLLKERPTMQ